VSNPSKTKRAVKITGLILLAAFIIIQFFRPDRTNPPSDPTKSLWSDTSVPKEVAGLIKRSCIDCHSNQTEWPWYSNVAPVSWLVADDVANGRKRVNFSTWLDYSDRKREKMRGNIAEEIASGDMPLGKYTFIHPSSKPTDEEKKSMAAWGED
jgi:hypothetical protein